MEKANLLRFNSYKMDTLHWQSPCYIAYTTANPYDLNETYKGKRILMYWDHNTVSGGWILSIGGKEVRTFYDLNSLDLEPGKKRVLKYAKSHITRQQNKRNNGN